MGRVEPVDAAAVQMLRSMADALDARPFNAQMWKEYRETLGGVIAGGDDSDAFAAVLEGLRAPVRDTPPA